MTTVEETLEIIKDTLKQKGTIYGSTYRRVATMLNVKPQYSIMVRILEKIARAYNILNSGEIDFDALKDQFIDIAGYAVLAAFECPPQQEIG